MPERTDLSGHWDSAYETRRETEHSWFEREPELSLEMIRLHSRPGDAIIDVGGGASRLALRLIEKGFGPVTVLDISGRALAICRGQLGDHGDAVRFINADITKWQPPQRYRVWHDRAVFHFLTDARDRAAYIQAMDRAVEPAGTAIIMTFADDGPEFCSGLPIAGYSTEMLAMAVANRVPGQFRRIDERRFVHHTPGGAEQKFQATVLHKPASAE